MKTFFHSFFCFKGIKVLKYLAPFLIALFIMHVYKPGAQSDTPAGLNPHNADSICQNLPKSSKKNAFLSITQETPLQSLTAKGEIPTWFKGTILGTGPAVYSLGNSNVDYWFNGLAVVHGFYFDKEIAYQNRFLQSIYYDRCTTNGNFGANSSKREEKKGFLSKITSVFTKPEPYDNGNVAIAAINNNIYALTETTLGVQIDPRTLQRVNEFNLNNDIEGHLTTAQFQYDSENNVWYNYVTNFGQTSSYNVYTIGTDNKARVLTSIPVKTPSYMRSFALSKDYVILIEVPFVVNPMDLMIKSGPFIEKVQWKPDLGTKFFIIDKKTGAVHTTITSSYPAFLFNTLNAWQEDDMLYIDAITYKNADVIPCVKYDALKNDNYPEYQPSYITRFSLDLKNDSCKVAHLKQQTCEFVTYNQNYATKPYNYVYGLSATHEYGFPQYLIKVNLVTGTSLIWQKAHCYASKPLFIANPQAIQEDDGIIVSVVTHSLKNKSFMLVLDAQSFQEIARLKLPCVIPLGIVLTYVR